MSGLDYEKSGVCLKKGDDFAEFIKALPSKAVSRGLGGFAGGSALDLSGYREPLMLSTTDGVGTKLLVAKRLGKWDTVGIDLVAMSVNDLIVCGAKPLQFLDYIACGKIDEKVLRDVIRGVVAGCELADCLLVGGETAEMPDLYAEGDIDLAGFAVGLVEKAKSLPSLDRMSEGDLVLGMPSSGLHSNGYSLARKCAGSPAAIAAFGGEDRLLEAMLIPTRIYVRELLSLVDTGLVLGAAHITGSGLFGNLERVIPKDLCLALSWDWPVPKVFEAIQKGGDVPSAEMRSVFNMGIGMALIAKRHDAEELLRIAKVGGIELLRIGELARG